MVKKESRQNYGHTLRYNSTIEPKPERIDPIIEIGPVLLLIFGEVAWGNAESFAKDFSEIGWAVKA